MKTVLVLLFIFGAAFAAPAEEPKKAPEAPVVKKVEAAAPEYEDKMMKKAEELPVPENSIIVPANAPVLKEAEGPESRYQMCPSGWFNYQHRCYLFVQSAMNWQDAESHCRGFGAHLAPVTNYAEYAYLQQLTKSAGQSVAWLGGFYLQSEWMWAASEGFYYTNWYSQSTASSYPCMYLSTSYGWRNTVCSNSYRFICSKNLYGC